jgi:hypothetical protein
MKISSLVSTRTMTASSPRPNCHRNSGSGCRVPIPTAAAASRPRSQPRRRLIMSRSRTAPGGMAVAVLVLVDLVLPGRSPRAPACSELVKKPYAVLASRGPQPKARTAMLPTEPPIWHLGDAVNFSGHNRVAAPEELNAKHALEGMRSHAATARTKLLVSVPASASCRFDR